MIGKMANDRFQSLINERFDINKIYSQIKSEKRGVLYKVINLLEKDEVKAKKVCECFGIETNSYLENDFSIIYDNIVKKFFDPVRKSFLIDKIDIWGLSTWLEKSIFTKLEEKTQMEFLIFAAFILLSGFALVKSKSLSQDQQQNISPEKGRAIPTAICLAVPASAVYDLTEGKLINRERIIQLIESAPEFLCIRKEEADEKIIETIVQEISPDSQLKFYIRIDIPNGQDIIGAETKYVIKRDIPKNKEGQIIQLGRLRDASVLKSFNRI